MYNVEVISKRGKHGSPYLARFKISDSYSMLFVINFNDLTTKLTHKVASVQVTDCIHTEKRHWTKDRLSIPS